MALALRKIIARDDNLFESESNVDVILDASHPDYLEKTLKAAKDYQAPLVIATTNYSKEQEAEILATSKEVAVIKASNFSLGVAVLTHLAKEASKYLKDDFDIEIVEHHHNQKIDIPSGTALSLFDSLNENNNFKLVTNRQGKRAKDEIGISSLRGGSVNGYHSVYFFGQQETLEINHQALSREIFASGMLKCAKLIVNCPPKYYTINELLFKETEDEC